VINTALLKEEYASFLRLHVKIIFIGAQDAGCPSFDPIISQIDLNGHTRFPAVWQVWLSVGMRFEEISLSVSEETQAFVNSKEEETLSEF
jgi:hypothetical protein